MNREQRENPMDKERIDFDVEAFQPFTRAEIHNTTRVSPPEMCLCQQGNQGNQVNRAAWRPV